MMIVVGQGWAALGTWPPFIALIGGVVAATLWSTFGPAKKPKGEPPRERLSTSTPASKVAAEPEVVPEPEPMSAAEPTAVAVAEADPLSDFGAAEEGGDGDETEAPPKI
ncbi:MAG: hypothetical protein ACR2QO_07595 [Acidimicrobiales bacterium]